jgi:hypothetical protein
MSSVRRLISGVYLANTMAGLLLMPAIFAQMVTGVVTGSVSDSSGQFIPGAAVTTTGDFVFTAVQPSRNTVSVESQGFKRLEVLTPEIGTVAESITVTAPGTPVQTSSQERSALLTSTQMER